MRIIVKPFNKPEIALEIDDMQIDQLRRNKYVYLNGPEFLQIVGGMVVYTNGPQGHYNVPIEQREAGKLRLFI